MPPLCVCAVHKGAISGVCTNIFMLGITLRLYREEWKEQMSDLAAVLKFLNMAAMEAERWFQSSEVQVNIGTRMGYTNFLENDQCEISLMVDGATWRILSKQRYIFWIFNPMGNYPSRFCMVLP